MSREEVERKAMIKAEDRGGMLNDLPANGKPVWICHRKHSFTATMKQIINGIWCLECNESVGERALRQHLEKKGIRYQTEKTFPGLRDKSSLRFDNWLPEYDLGIEIDGEFHFKKILTQEDKEKILKKKKGVKKPNAAKRLINQINHDIDKDMWCKETQNSMLRIPFWELPILEKIVDEKIKEIDKDKKRGIKKIYYWCSYADWRIEALKALNSKGKNKIPMPKCPAPRGTHKKTWDNRKERNQLEKMILDIEIFSSISKETPIKIKKIPKEKKKSSKKENTIISKPKHKKTSTTKLLVTPKKKKTKSNISR